MRVVKGYKIPKSKIKKVIFLRLKGKPNYVISAMLDLPVEIVREIDASYLRDDKE